MPRSAAASSAYAGIAEATQIVGRNSRDIENVLGFAGRAEMIHRDDMVLVGEYEGVARLALLAELVSFATPLCAMAMTVHMHKRLSQARMGAGRKKMIHHITALRPV